MNSIKSAWTISELNVIKALALQILLCQLIGLGKNEGEHPPETEEKQVAH